MLSLLTAFIVISCTSPTFAAQKDLNQQLENLDSKVSQQADIIRRLRQENKLLRAKKVRPSQQAKVKGSSAAISDKALFLKFKHSFERGDKKSYRKALRLLAKNYPKSSYFAEVYMMAGRSALAKKKYKTAVRSFDKVIKRYPKAKIAVNALYLKAFTYQEMKVTKPAIRIYEHIKKNYPQTSLAYRAKLQLKLLSKK